jgi:predicted nucleic acid-binding protein
MTSHVALVDATPLPAPVSADPDDDKFPAAALAASAPLIVSGDRHLLAVSGWQGMRVLSPRRFVDEYLPQP